MKVETFRPDHLAMLDIQPAQADAVAAMQQEGYGRFLAESGPAFTGFDGDRCVICAGVVTLWPGRMSLWAVLSVHAARLMLPIHRTAVDVIRTLPVRRVEATCATGFEPGHRWLRMLGFTREGTLRRYTPEGHDHDMYSRTT